MEIFEVNNVKCGGCASNIENALKALPGVENVEVVIEHGKVSVNGGVDRAQIAQALNTAGYPER